MINHLSVNKSYINFKKKSECRRQNSEDRMKNSESGSKELVLG